MIRPILTLRRRRVVVDVDSQCDFFLAEGSQCVRNHRRVLANMRRIMAWARLSNVRVISTVRDFIGSDGHEGGSNGFKGQDKIHYTMRNKSISFSANGCTDLPRDIFRDYEQVILHKRCVDPFVEPRADRMLSEIRVDEFLVIGALTEGAVKSTVLGLLARRKRVTILTDAIGGRDRGAAEVALRQMQAKGARLAEVKSFVGISGLRLVGACGCDRCCGKMNKTYADPDQRAAAEG